MCIYMFIDYMRRFNIGLYTEGKKEMNEEMKRVCV